jgi:lipid II:glycine glycyltransferase (peptidoglycan interpeptide bridge formation enzyme)
MKINIIMTKDKTNHKSFLVFIPQHTVKKVEKILEQLEKKTEVPWRVNVKKTDTKYLAVETGDMTGLFLKVKLETGDEKAYVNWRMKWKNEVIEISTGK